MNFGKIEEQKNILLFNPGGPDFTMRGLTRERPSSFGFCWPSIDLVLTSGLLNKNHYNLHYVDASLDRLSPEDISRIVQEKRVAVIVSLFSRYLYENDSTFLKDIKDSNPSVIIILLPDILHLLNSKKALAFIEKHDWIEAIVLNLVINDLVKFIDGESCEGLRNLCYRI